MAMKHHKAARTRLDRRTRQIPHTIDGTTRLVDDHYDIEIEAPPRDIDHLVLTAVTIAAALLLLAVIAWSTVSIGGLLDRTAPQYAAYAAALVFDTAWIMCAALEWIDRYDRQKSRAPRNAGWAALAIAMTAIAADGALSGHLWTGIIGALVSALGKGLSSMVLRHYSIDLDDRTLQFINQEKKEANARYVLAGLRRGLARVDAQTAAIERITNPAPALHEARPEARPEAPPTPVTRPDTPHDAPQVNPTNTAPTKTAAILTASQTLHADAGPTDIVKHLKKQGVNVNPSYVRTVLSRAAKTRGNVEDGGGYL